MRRVNKKRASLNLSVNAIVIFVLAFAMLSVGLVFTNSLKTKLLEGFSSAVSIDDLKNPPSPDNPLTIATEIDVKQNKNEKMEIGFYNTDNTVAVNAKIGIAQCIKADTNLAMPTDRLPTVVSPMQNVDPSTGSGFNVIIKLPERVSGADAGNYDTGTYVCTMAVYNAGTGTTLPDPTKTNTAEGGYIYYQKQFFMEVIA